MLLKARLAFRVVALIPPLFLIHVRQVVILLTPATVPIHRLMVCISIMASTTELRACL